MQNQNKFLSASMWGNAEVVIALLEDKAVNPSVWDNYAIRNASQNGHLEVVRALLKDKRVDPSAKYNEAITAAFGNGHFYVVKLLLHDLRVNPDVLEWYQFFSKVKNEPSLGNINKMYIFAYHNRDNVIIFKGYIILVWKFIAIHNAKPRKISIGIYKWTRGGG